MDDVFVALARKPDVFSEKISFHNKGSLLIQYSHNERCANLKKMMEYKGSIIYNSWQVSRQD
jgi:hypothetical protein